MKQVSPRGDPNDLLLATSETGPVFGTVHRDHRPRSSASSRTRASATGCRGTDPRLRSFRKQDWARYAASPATRKARTDAERFRRAGRLQKSGFDGETLAARPQHKSRLRRSHYRTRRGPEPHRWRGVDCRSLAERRSGSPPRARLSQVARCNALAERWGGYCFGAKGTASSHATLPHASRRCDG